MLIKETARAMLPGMAALIAAASISLPSPLAATFGSPASLLSASAGSPATDPGKAESRTLQAARAAGNSAGQKPAASSVLTAQDKELLGRALRIKQALGDEVWPGFAGAAIPVIVYNDAFEFLTGFEGAPPAPWTPVADDKFAGAPYYRRPASNSQSFAVKVGDVWAASMSTLDQMTRKIPFKISPELYVTYVLHEAFHAFQSGRDPARFHRILLLYSQESGYPAADPAFAKAWTEEGALLAAALKALGEGGAAAGSADRARVVDDVRLFLKSRQARLAKVPFGVGVDDYEKEMEWLEGLGKYAEVRFYEMAGARARTGEPGFEGFKAEPPFFVGDLARLSRQLGALTGDQRFYLSGMAQAMILDRLAPGWKQGFFPEGGSFEDRLSRLVL